MTDKLVTIFGGGGFVGRYAVQALLRAGARVRIAERNPKRAWFLKAQGNLGQVQFVGADVTRPDTLARAVAGASAVINLVGSFDNMDAVQATGAANVARAAAAEAKSLVHVSAIGADVDSPSRYGRTKGEGEAAVRDAFATATILRPSIVFGREDSFLNRFAGLVKALPVCPVIGGRTKFQPIFVGDLGRAIARAAHEPDVFAGKTYELGGPKVLTMLELNQWIADAIGRSPLFLEIPDAVAGPLATLTGWLPGAPLSRDQWLMLQQDNIVSENALGIATFGIAPTSIEAAAPSWLVQFRRHGRFGAAA